MDDAEIVERMLEAWNRQDLDALLALSHPEVEYVNAPEAIEPGTRRGHEELTTAMRAQWETLTGAWQEVDRVYVLEDELLTAGRICRTMPGSEATVENRVLLSWRIRDGKVIRLAVLGAGSEFQGALEAAGVEP